MSSTSNGNIERDECTSATRRALRRPAFVSAALAISLFIVGAPANANGAPPSVVVLEPILDTSLIEPFGDSDSNSNGMGPVVIAGETSKSGSRRGLLAFDLEGQIPDMADIQSVTLTLTVDRVGSAALDSSFAIHRALGPWGEGESSASTGGGAPATLGDATWAASHFDPAGTETILWDSVGGDFEPTESATAPLLEATSIDFSGAGLVADVEAWLATPEDDFGWILIGDEATAASVAVFYSREHDVPAERPTLTIEYLPEPASGAAIAACLVTLGVLRRSKSA